MDNTAESLSIASLAILALFIAASPSSPNVTPRIAIGLTVMSLFVTILFIGRIIIRIRNLNTVGHSKKGSDASSPNVAAVSSASIRNEKMEAAATVYDSQPQSSFETRSSVDDASSRDSVQMTAMASRSSLSPPLSSIETVVNPDAVSA